MPISLEDLGNLINNPGNAQGAAQTVADPASVLQDKFMQTPGYQLAYGQNYELDPAERFRADSGHQLAVQEGLRPLLNRYASQGLNQSGALARALSDYQFKNYGDFVQGQQGLFKDYQNQLAGLSQFGAGQTGSQNLLANQQMLAQLQANANLQTGQGIAQAGLSTGQNISSLLANQGVLGAGGYLNTGGAINTNYMNQIGLMSQLAAQQQAAQASAAGGQGAMAGTQSPEGMIQGAMQSNGTYGNSGGSGGGLF